MIKIYIKNKRIDGKDLITFHNKIAVKIIIANVGVSMINNRKYF